MTVVLLGLGSGAFMMVTMQYRFILYPLGLLGVTTSYWLYFRARRICDAEACKMPGKHWNLITLGVSTILIGIVTYVDFFLISM